MRRSLAFILAAFVTFLGARPAGAQAQKPTSQTTEYSPYEREAIENALDGLKLSIEPAPEGKTVGEIHVVRLEVLEPRDPGPELLKPVPVVSPLGHVVTKPMLNWLHILSKEWIIRRELLLNEGEPYVQVLVDETARNMRARMPLQISLVVIVPVKSKDPNKVDLLVVAKDIWSLRLSFDVAVTPGGLESLVIVPQETNFLGLQHTVSTRFLYQPASFTLGAGYKVPRFGHTWIGAAASASVTINQNTNTPEGSAASVSVGQSLYSTRTPWAWDADVGYDVGVRRRYSNAHVFLFDSPLTRGVRERIPYEYKARSFAGSASVTRSFGWAIKNNFSLSMNTSTADYSLFENTLATASPVAAADFTRRVLPTSETRVYPSLSWTTFTTNYLRTLDINTLALQEDYRLGHNVGVTFYPVPKALGSTRDIVGLSAHAGYIVPLGDGLAGANVSWFAEDEPGRSGCDGPPNTGVRRDDGIPCEVTDGAIGASFGAVTPRIFGAGRIALNVSFNNRYRNYLNSRATLGGSDRLRGYPTAFFSGKDTVLYNLEYRSRSVEILKAQLAGVAFYDAGDAATGFDMFHPKQSVGLGVRALFPQVNRLAFRFDFAIPLNRGPFPETGSPGLVPPYGFFFGFDQAFAP